MMKADGFGQGLPAPGLSLLELVVALAIVAILLAVAVPSYRGYVQRADRADAVRRLLAAVACQERIRASSGHYDTTRCGDPGGEAYSLRFMPAGVTDTLEFMAIAEPLRPDAADRCGSLAVDQAGTRSISGSAGGLSACWGGR